MSWYDPTSWFDDAPLDTDLTPQAAAAGFESQVAYDQYILDQSQQALYLSGGGGSDQVALGSGIVQESLGRWTVAEAQAALPANVKLEQAPYLYSLGGSLGSVLADTRSGLAGAKEIVALSHDLSTMGDPVPVGRGANAGVWLPRRTTGSGQPGSLSGPTGAWGNSVQSLTADPSRLLLTVAVGAAAVFAAKRLLQSV